MKLLSFIQVCCVNNSSQPQAIEINTNHPEKVKKLKSLTLQNKISTETNNMSNISNEKIGRELIEKGIVDKNRLFEEDIEQRIKKLEKIVNKVKQLELEVV